jgi:hypothetical protein
VPTIIHSAECDTSLAPFQKRGTPAFLRKIAFVLHPLCVVSWLVAPDVVEYKDLQSDGHQRGQDYYLEQVHTQGQPDWPAPFHCGR